MEPVSLIVAALITGATTGVKNTMTKAVIDAYEGLERVGAGRDELLVAAARGVQFGDHNVQSNVFNAPKA